MDLMDVMKFDGDLAVGDTVEARWTHSHRYYRAVGFVTKLNDCTAKVKLLNGNDTYPEGFVVTVTRCTFRSIERWSWNNGVFPVERCPGCGVHCVSLDVEHLDDCAYQGRSARRFPYADAAR
jgi:hypothetical protein